MNIPALPRKPLVGNLPEWRADRLALLRQAANTGEPLIAFHLGTWPIVLINTPDLIEDVLVRDHGLFEKSPMLRRHLRPILGDGILTTDNQTNQKRKRIIGSIFQNAFLETLHEPITDQALQSITAWKRDGVIAIDTACIDLTLSILGYILVGNPINYRSDTDLQWALNEANRYGNLKTTDLIDLPLWVPLARHKRLRQAITIIDTKIQGLIDQHAAGTATPSILSRLLDASDETGAKLTKTEIRDELVTFFFAGHETTAVALQWALMLVAAHPDLETRLRREIDQVLHGRRPTPHDLARLPLLQATIQEVLRLYPPIYLLARSAIQPTTVGGYAIPHQCSLAISPYTLHRNADHFPDPDAFNPDRWLGAAPPRYSYIPFGVGPRQCIGKHLASLELSLVLATILQQATITFPGGIAAPEPMITLRPQGNLQAIVKPVEQAVEVGA